MEQIEAYPVTYGILGLLAFWGPLSGYDLKRLFDHTLAPMWGAAQSQIYKELRRMKEYQQEMADFTTFLRGKISE